MSKERCSDRLHRLGFTHEPANNPWDSGVHAIRRKSDGALIGEMDAYEASAFCLGVETARAEVTP